MLYSSVDDYLLRELIPRYEAHAGVRVDLVGDTEATKSAGLAERVIAERARPRGDVWWSSEPFFTIRLAREGLLEPGAASAGAGESASAWPAGLVAGDGSWVGFASRARVIVYRRERVPEGEVPRRLADLADPRWRGRVAMARPEFGTTRGHLAALIEYDGLEVAEAWLRAMVENGLKVYSGNATVVRAVAQGEADLGLTDTDDVWAGQRNGWDVGAVFEAADDEFVDGLDGATGRSSGRPVPTTEEVGVDGRPRSNDESGDGPNGTSGREASVAPSGDRWHGEVRLTSRGPLVLPNTAGLIRGGPNSSEGRRLLAWILGGEAERVLAASESRNYPVHPGLADVAVEPALPPRAWRPDLEAVADHLDEASGMGARVLGA